MQQGKGIPPQSIGKTQASAAHASRTLDAVARAAKTPARTPDLLGYGTYSSATQLWPSMGRLHWIALAILIVLPTVAFFNSLTTLVSYHDKYNAGYTLDNKYIIELDPRTKASNWDDAPGQPGRWNIWTKDYWWPKGISGLFRPLITWSYWFNWHVIGGDETRIDAKLPDEVKNSIVEEIRHRRMLWFHIVNHVSHVGTAVLVYLCGLLLTQRFWTALAISALFSVHPVTVESVTNVIGRADIWASATVLGGLLLHARARVTRRRWKIPWLLGLALVTTFGLFSKESAITVVPVIVLYDCVFGWTIKQLARFLLACAIAAVTAGVFFGAFKLGSMLLPTSIAATLVVLVAVVLLGAAVVLFQEKLREEPWQSMLYYAVLVLPIVGMFVARHYVFAAATPPETPFLDNPIRGVNWFAGRLTAFQVTVRLWWILLFPYNLSGDYSFNQIPTFGKFSNTANDLFCLVATVMVFAVVVLGFWLWLTKRSKPAAFFIFYFFATFILTSNIIYTIGSIMADRFMYGPMVGFIGCLVLFVEWGARWLARQFAIDAPKAPAPPASETSPEQFAGDWLPLRSSFGIATYSFLAIVAVLYGVRTAFRNLDWRSDATLWASTIKQSPTSFRSYQSFAFALFEEFNKPKDQRQPMTTDVTIDQVISVAEGARPIVDQLPDHLNSSRLYLHIGMYYGLRGDLLSTRTPNGDVIATDQSRPSYVKSIEALERGVPVDRAFNRINTQKEIQRGKKPEEISTVGLLQVYEYLGNSYLRLRQIDKALDAYIYMRLLDPTNPDAYVKVAQAYIERNEPEKASIALLQAMWLDPARQHLWEAVAQLLQSINSDPRPAVVRVPNGPLRLDATVPIAQSVLCSMYQGFVRIFLEQKMVPQAELVRKIAVIDTGFPQSLFDAIFQEFNRVPPVLPPRTPPVVTPPPPGALPTTGPVPVPGQTPARMPPGR